MEETNIPTQATVSTLLSDVRSIVEQGLQRAYQGVNVVMVKTYWQVGRRIVEEEQQGEKRAEYGKQIISLLSEDLSKSYSKGFTARDLRSYRQFYLSFKDLEIWHSRVPNLSWTHFRTMLRVTDDDARYWYMREAAQEMWSVRTLDRNIASQYYNRLLQSPKKEEVIAEMKRLTAPLQDPRELVKSPVVAEFLGLPSNAAFTETELEKAIIHHLKDFLLEFGKGFAFVAEQQHIRTDDNDYFIDLVFYNYLLKSFVLIDLKTTRLSYQDVGQMDMYLKMYDELKRTEGDNPTVGIILCSETDGDVVRYSTLAKNDKLFAAKYLTYLPTEEQLKREIEQQKLLFEQQNSTATP
jgi:predicted nuclease of restriction endonuclease-like (RecB) superfamily